MKLKRNKKRYRYASGRRRLYTRRFMIVSICTILVAAIVSAVIFIGSQLVPRVPTASEGPSQSSQSSASSEKPSSEESSQPSSESSESQEESSSQPSSEPSSSQPEVSVADDAPDYQKKYPDLYVTDRPKMHVLDDDAKVVYLTFDDGPSDLTAPLLDVLKKYNAKATFFDCCQSDYQEEFAPLMKRCVDEGHTVAVHTYSHQFKEVYQSVEAYLDDFYKMYKLIEETTGQKPANFFRFPGGSKNGYNGDVYQDIIKEMTRRGFIYYDWDGDSGDAAGGNVSGATIYANTMDAIHKGCNIILMHNIFDKKATLEQVGKIIKTAQKEGYEFKALDGTLDPSHGYLMTTKEFVSAAMDSQFIQLSDWRMEKEKAKGNR